MGVCNTPYIAMKIVTHFLSQLRHQQYLIAFSGGLDSTALLSLMAKARENQPHLQLRAVHIHHGLNPNADQWVKHCEQVCHQFDIPLIIRKVKVNQGNGIEHGARLARYQAIAEIRLMDEIVVTAHHLQDQTETFFLALKRGSGLQGLSAMQPYSELYGMPIFRPLLIWQREQLVQYITSEKLSWIEDDSNADNRYERNFLRNQILPALRQRWQHFDQMVVRSAQHCYQQQQLIHQLLADDFQQNFDKNHRTFSLVQFTKYNELTQKALLRMWLTELKQHMPSIVQLEQIIQDVILARADANPQYHLVDKVIRRYQQKLYLTADFENVNDFTALLTPEQKCILPDNIGSLVIQKKTSVYTAVWQGEQGLQQLELPLTAQTISVKFAYSGSVCLKGEKINRDIKKIWQQLNVPVWQRQRIPLIFYDNKLQGAVGFFTTA
ncbi:tRNA(Ile)-lysidine synthase [Lonepinella koalarum]|uniref:tRNA(Ile)-lysidine synthase n=2 Tax=Lonepinella koalarum TaxID=53417 RepID=A0A4R1KVM8_9PAST|nr:tRNA(Ile)-lysidine synthase [Lonepinella koalarum]